MMYWILVISLLLFGCGGGETGDTMEEGTDTVGKEVSDALHEAQDSAEELGEVLEGAKKDLDEAIDDADSKPDD